ncbi:MAG: FmdB family zinc ribbon protein [Candidatus Promineifilaceae bacterium]|nr:FmdB family zinc ribbon protein [Candidatus Promineifilaceae bacterium]
MPYYEFRCRDCGRKVRLFYTYEEYDHAEPRCPNCESRNLKRLISRIALAKSEESRLDAMDPDSMMADLDEEDPRSLGRFMRRMSQEMGEDLGDEFNEVVDRLESGESPDSIEESMPELADDAGGMTFDD